MYALSKKVLIFFGLFLIIQIIGLSVYDSVKNSVVSREVKVTNTQNDIEKLVKSNSKNKSDKTITSDDNKNNELSGDKNIIEETSSTVHKKYTTSKKLKIYKVERVIDGDTFVILYNGEEEKVRLIGVDTPESVNYDPNKNCKFGNVASAYTKKLLSGKEVGIEFGEGSVRDNYNRLLGYVYLNNEMVNYKLVYKGYAVVMTVSPNVQYSNIFTQAQLNAQDKKRGMWNSAVSVSDCPNKAESMIE